MFHRLKKDKDLRAFLPHVVAQPVKFARRIRERPSINSDYLMGLKTSCALPTRLPALSLNWSENKLHFPDCVSLRLASRSLHAVKLSAIPWQHIFDDSEDTASLHRFAWLLPLVLQCMAEGITEKEVWQQTHIAIEDWCSHHPEPQASAEPWQSYTISERLVNWIVAALACDIQPTQCSTLSVAIIRQAEYLLNNLEYYGDLFTGNHLSNNGRALYIAGLVLSNHEYYNAGKYMILKERERLFAEPMFLREGSSHYQFLVTRNYCEILSFAREYSDDETVSELKSTVTELTKGCNYFLLNSEDGTWDIPLIGDISPDCPPQWLLGVPWVGAMLTAAKPPGVIPAGYGWHTFFIKAEPTPESFHKEEPDGISSGKEWAKIQYKHWTVFAHVNPLGFPIIAGHAHQDSGAIVAYYFDRPLLIDCGRKHYRDDAVGRRGCDWLAHTIAVLEYCNPAPYYRRIYPDSFLNERTGQRPELTVSGSSLQIRHGGFARIKGGGLYSRKVICVERVMTIQDLFEGQGIHEVVLLYHIPWRVEKEGNAVLIKTDGKHECFKMTGPSDITNITIYFGIDEDCNYGWASRTYGDSSSLSTIVVKGKVRLPWTGITTIEKI